MDFNSPSIRLLLIALLGVWLAISPVPHPSLAQDERPADNATAAQIADAAAKARDGKFLDAVEQFQRILDTAGDELVPVDRSQHVPARWVVHGHLGRLKADGLKLYRQRVDGQAAKRIDDAKKSRDDAALQRLLSDMFAASANEDAILELARRAFERGEFDAAEHYWRMLLPPLEGDGRLLRFPNPKITVAAVQARLMLVKLFRGERDEVRSELKAFKEKHADAAGLLAGKTGKYVDTLTELLSDPAKTTLPRSPDEPGWPTFAGSPSRLGSLRTKLPYFWPDVPTWKAPLPLVRRDRFENPAPDGTHPRSLAFHPIVSNGRAYVADGARVFVIELMSGGLATSVWPKGGEETSIPTLRDERYTLTEHEGILYARLGPSALEARDGGAASFIIALGARKGKTEDRDALWKLEPPAGGDGVTHFEGAPVVHRDRLYVGIWRQSGGDASAGIACYRIDEPAKTPELVWQRTVGKAGSEPNGETRYRHALVTISGPNVVYCTDGGAIVALNAISGRPAWEYRYPRNERPTMPRYRDLCPPLADGGRIYAAPADTDRLLCLDAYTGRLIWEREGVEVVHLLGVARGRLIATFAGKEKGIRGLNVRTGADSGDNGWTILDDGGEMTFGRGLVTEEAVVWPTKHRMHFINPADGTRLRSPIRGPIPKQLEGIPIPPEAALPFGNLCYADGVLLVTTATEVWGYVTEAKKLSDRRKAVEKEPDNAALHADLTQSLIDAGQYAEAEKEAAKAGDAKERLLWLLAEKIIRDGDKEGAKRLYGELAKGDGSFAAAGAVRLAEMTDESGKVRAVWEHRFPFDATDQEMLIARAAWHNVWEKTGEILDQQGIPYLARRYAEDHSPVPLVMRSYFLGRGSEVKQIARDSPSPLTRSRDHDWDRPQLRILATLEQGVIATDERLLLFGLDVALPTTLTIDTALYIGEGVWQPEPATVILAGSESLVAVDPIEGRLRWRIEPTVHTPTITIRDRPSLPLATGEPIKRFSVIGVDRRRVKVFVSGTSSVSFEGDYAFRYRAESSPQKYLTSFNSRSAHSLGYSIYQLSNGRMLINRSYGKDSRESLSCPKPWPEDPIAIDNDLRKFKEDQPVRFLIPDDASVFLFDAKAGKELARYTIPGVDSLTGELPRFRMFQGDPLLIIDRNHGVELDRLKIDGLKRAWKREPIFVGRELDDVAFSGERFFFAADGTLAAHGWKEGERVWEIPLPESPHTKWKITVAPQGLLVHPAEALMLNPDFDAIGEFRKAGWNRERLLRAVSKSYDVWTARELPILVIDPADGRLIQRLSFPAAGPAAGVAVMTKGVVVVTGRGSWTLAAK